MKDHGKKPYIVDIEDLTVSNENFRQAVWTGSYLQMTVMSIEVGGEVGLEVHEDTDQFLAHMGHTSFTVAALWFRESESMVNHNTIRMVIQDPHAHGSRFRGGDQRIWFKQGPGAQAGGWSSLL